MKRRLDPTDNTTPRLLTRLERASTDLAATIARIPTTITRLTDAQPGYPSDPGTTSSSNIASDETSGPSTQPERYEALMRDDVLRDLAELDKLTDVLQRTAQRTRDIASKWGSTLIGTRVSDPADSMWCTSCLRTNSFEPRRHEGGSLCWWCDRTLRAINAVRAEHSLPLFDVVPLGAAQKHARLAASSSRRVPITAHDIDTWAGINPQATRHQKARAKR